MARGAAVRQVTEAVAVVAVNDEVPVPPAGLDMGKPVPLKFWALQSTDKFGNGIERMAMVGNSFNNHEGASGMVLSIWFYPENGCVAIEIQPNYLQPKSERPPSKFIIVANGGHGQTTTATEMAEKLAGRF